MSHGYTRRHAELMQSRSQHSSALACMEENSSSQMISTPTMLDSQLCILLNDIRIFHAMSAGNLDTA